MAETVKKADLTPPKGFWMLPGGKDGLQGTPEGVRRALEAHPMPEHDRKALLEKIAAELDGKDFNWLHIYGTQTRHETESGADTILSLHIKTSKKNL
jgi:hypothetical protein